MIPASSSAIPLFLLFRYFNLLDTHIALILAYLTFNVPFVTWLMRAFFLELPEELEECAMIDDAIQLRAFAKITIPLSAPGIAVVRIFCFIFAYSELVLALILTRGKAQTVPVLVLLFRETDWISKPLMAVAAVTAAILIIVLGIIVQKCIVKGLTLDALK